MTGIIILAAGASTRMGSPKQLLPYQDNTLLQYSIDVALSTGFSPVIVVIGAMAQDILPIINNDRITIVENQEWQEGLGSSVRIGISTLMDQSPLVESAILMLCDQPFVTNSLLHQLVETKIATHKKIVASTYKNTAGVPVLFDKSFFPELLQLQGQDGAKKLLIQHSAEVATVPFPEGAIDIDTPEDYDTFITVTE
jgi:molybdenum cofactor cytidylyltransferase